MKLKEKQFFSFKGVVKDVKEVSNIFLEGKDEDQEQDFLNLAENKFIILMNFQKSDS